VLPSSFGDNKSFTVYGLIDGEHAFIMASTWYCNGHMQTHSAAPECRCPAGRNEPSRPPPPWDWL